MEFHQLLDKYIRRRIKVTDSVIYFNSNGCHQNLRKKLILFFGDRAHRGFDEWCASLNSDGVYCIAINGNNEDHYTWYKNGKRHRDDDQPTQVNSNGKKYWFKNDKIHRENGPAVIHKNKTEEYWKNGTKTYIKKHNGTKEWYKGNKLHRDNDEPAVIRSNGTKEWWQNGKRHREKDKPAIIRGSGRKEWWYEGDLFREHNKPTIILPNKKELTKHYNIRRRIKFR